MAISPTLKLMDAALQLPLSDGAPSAFHPAPCSLVLGLFPGIGLLDKAFEETGFCVVRGPDPLWGGDVHNFHPVKGAFAGIIGGPPCQAHSRYAALNRAQGNSVALDLVPEFVRVIEEAQPEWWVMENVPDVPSVKITGYITHRQILDNRWLGEEQSRKRAFQFGTRDGRRLDVESFALEHPNREAACLATEGAAGRISFKNGKSVYNSRRDLGRFCELQGLPRDFLDHAPFTMEAKFRVVGNGVPLPMGRAIAQAVRRAFYPGNVERSAPAESEKRK